MKSLVFAIDFDGTCVDHRYPNIGQDVPHCVNVLTRLVNAGHKIILYTMRSNGSSDGPMLDPAVEWFAGHNIPLYGVNKNKTQFSWSKSPKVYANIYIDDAALGTPLIELASFNRKCVDWAKIEQLLIDRGML